MRDDNRNFDNLSDKIHNLEHKLNFLEQSLSQGNNPSVKGSVQVTGALEITKIKPVKISKEKLVEIYNDVPQLLSEYTIKVSLTAESYRKINQGKIILEKSARGNYSVISTEEKGKNKYWLLPHGNITINIYKVKTVQSLFKLEGEQPSNTSEFTLKEPAIVSIMPTGKQWKLEEQGILYVGKTSRSSQLPSELEQINKQHEQLQSQLDQLQSLLKQADKERRQMRSQIEQMSQERSLLRSQLDQLNHKLQVLEGNLSTNSQGNSPYNGVVPTQEEKVSDTAKPPATDTELQATSGQTPAPWQKVKLLRTLTGHTNSVRSLAISSWQEQSDRQILASGSFDNTIKIWNLNTGKLLNTLTGDSIINAIAISPDGKNLVSGSDDNTIKIWNLDTGELLRTLTGHSNCISSVTINPDGKTLASSSRDNTIKIWNLYTGELLHTLFGHLKAVLSVAISPDGQTLVSSDSNCAIKIWNLHTGKLLRTLTGHSSLVWSVAINPNGETLASGSGDRTIKIWNLVTGELLNTLTSHSDAVLSVAINPDGQTLASGSGDRTIKIWNLATGELLRTLTDHSGEVYSIIISSDAQFLASGSQDKKIRIWRASS
ncbi:MAG: hypothetical protein AB4426_14070 [Xenococcaceae cyanobacterium]